MELFDCHCHIDRQPSSLTESAQAGIVRGRLLCGVSPDDWQAVEDAACGWPGTRTAYGIHPWHADCPPESIDRLEQILAARPASWVGEIGLDGLHHGAPAMAMQEAVFSRQLRLAARLDRPVNLHCVKAWDSLFRLLDADYLHDGPRDFILHSFGGPHQAVAELVHRGAYFSVGPLASSRDTPRTRRRIALLPDQRLLLESDAFVQPGRDATGDLQTTLHWLAEVRGTGAGDLSVLLADNTGRLFPP